MINRNKQSGTWWQRTFERLMSFIQRGFKTDPPATPTPQAPAQTVERHKVAGISHRLDALRPLAVKNDDFDKSKRELIEDGLIGERIYRTDFFATTTTLVPEPDNPVDPKAIKVVADGAHIGYIKSGSCSHIHKLIREGRIKSIKCEIAGGDYKMIFEDFNEDNVYTLEKDNVPIHAVVSIILN